MNRHLRHWFTWITLFPFYDFLWKIYILWINKRINSFSIILKILHKLIIILYLKSVKSRSAYFELQDFMKKRKRQNFLLSLILDYSFFFALFIFCFSYFYLFLFNSLQDFSRLHFNKTLFCQVSEQTEQCQYFLSRRNFEKPVCL